MKWWLISDEDVRLIRDSLMSPEHEPNDFNCPHPGDGYYAAECSRCVAVEKRGKALYALDSGLHKTEAIPDDWRKLKMSEETLTERRAEFVYNAAILAALAANAPVVPGPWAEREQDFRLQFLSVIERQCGEKRSHSPEELHGSWMQSYINMGWKHGEKYDKENRIHPDLVPYAQLGQLEQDKDAVFVALCEIARLWIRRCP